MGKTRITAQLKMPVDGVPKLLAALEALASQEVVVGFPESKDKPRTDGGSTNAEIAYVNDKGSPAKGIPPRPFMEPGVEDAKPNITPQLEYAGRAALAGQKEEVNKGLTAAGLAGVSGIKNKIVTGPFKPLSKRTLAARKARGVKRTKPLIDTAQMTNAVNFAVRKKRP